MVKIVPLPVVRPVHSGWTFSFVPGATPKKPFSGLIAYRLPSSPVRIQAMSSPTVKPCTRRSVALRRDQHCQVGLSARGRECSGDIYGFAVGFLYAEDQHMLCHPALGLALVGSDAQREAFFTEQHVPAVCGVDGPDGVVFREVADVAVLRIDVCICSAGRVPKSLAVSPRTS